MTRYYFASFWVQTSDGHGDEFGQVLSNLPRKASIVSRIIHEHPFTWLGKFKEKQAKDMESQTGPLMYVDYELISWQEITLREVELAKGNDIYQ